MKNLHKKIGKELNPEIYPTESETIGPDKRNLFSEEKR
jgi:hypothetical protein